MVAESLLLAVATAPASLYLAVYVKVSSSSPFLSYFIVSLLAFLLKWQFPITIILSVLILYHQFHTSQLFPSLTTTFSYRILVAPHSSPWTQQTLSLPHREITTPTNGTLSRSFATFESFGSLSISTTIRPHNLLPKSPFSLPLIHRIWCLFAAIFLVIIVCFVIYCIWWLFVALCTDWVGLQLAVSSPGSCG